MYIFRKNYNLFYLVIGNGATWNLKKLAIISKWKLFKGYAYIMNYLQCESYNVTVCNKNEEYYCSMVEILRNQSWRGRGLPK